MSGATINGKPLLSLNPVAPEIFRNDIEVCNCILVGRLLDDLYELGWQARRRNTHLHSSDGVHLGNRGCPSGVDRQAFPIAKSLQPQDANNPWWCTHGRRVADIHDRECISTACTYENLRKE